MQSKPYLAEPLTFDGVSSRCALWPISVQSLGALSLGSTGGVILEASVANAANDRRYFRCLSRTNPPSECQSAAGIPVRATAAAINISRAAAAAARHPKHPSLVVELAAE